ncbi:MAG: mRNA-binding ribosome synthesis protein nop7 [Vezdaea aestivalis]|nr:MAG: mRNA-binding ribosome synthesis protein nop7 [Vezdaea aestivalis]
MARIKKKGLSGQAKNYITRSQAVRKLQVTLADFRRLCIFKGIYPREPRSRKKASKSSTPSTTFYYTKDIQYLLHEPVLQQLRDQKTFQKKLSKAIGRGDYSDAARIEKTRRPRIRLDHIVRERYPTFVDALRDLDDPLCMLFLFSNLPSTDAVSSKTISKCEKLCLEFQNYVIETNSLRKSFLSIKGIYYQATIQGQDIMWLVPYKFTPSLGGDLDFRIMGTFVEFYTTLLSFVNYRLYTSISLVYPPKFDSQSDEKGGELRSFTLEGKSDGRQKVLANDSRDHEMPDVSRAESIAARAANLSSVANLQHDGDEAEIDAIYAAREDDEGEIPSTSIDKFEKPSDPDADEFLQPEFTDSDAPKKLFADFTFYLSRETPRQPLEFLLRAFGCVRIGWDSILGDGAFTNDETHPSITHQIVDRPVIMPQTSVRAKGEENSSAVIVDHPAPKSIDRIYIQPQWIWDSVNACSPMRPDLYAPGAELPPHLSPWVKPRKGQYDPTRPLEEQEQPGEAEIAAIEGDEVLGAEIDHSEGNHSSDAGSQQDSSLESDFGMYVASDEDIECGSESEESFAGFDSASNQEESANEDVDEEKVLQLELEAEAAGLSVSGSKKTSSNSSGKVKSADIRQQLSKKQRAEQEELERKLMMMSRKKRKLFEKMTYSNKEKESQAEALRSKRRKLEKQGSR